MASTALALSRLLQLASPTLPVGAYSYSQGLEWAIECGWIKDEASAGQWIAEVLHCSLLSLELPLMMQQMTAWAAGEHARLIELNDIFLASRESAELYRETRQMGYSMLRLIDDLGLGTAEQRAVLLHLDDVAYPSAWSLAATVFDVDIEAAATAYAWGWLENQVMAAIKAVPLGQLSGQRLLLDLSRTLAERLPALAACGQSQWNTLTPGLAIASCLHETQYSRIFRS